MVGHKTYYRTSDVREFVRSHMDFQTYQDFEKKHPKPKGEDKSDENDEWFCSVYAYTCLKILHHHAKENEQCFLCGCYSLKSVLDILGDNRSGTL